MVSDRSGSFAEFVSLRSRSLQRTAYLIAGDRDIAQDLVQEALIRTCIAWRRLRDPRRAEAFARKAIATAAIDGSRHGRLHEVTVPEADATSSDRPADLDDRTWLWLCLLRLPRGQRTAIVLRFYDDLSEREAAETMDCSVAAVRRHVATGLVALRALAGDALPLEEVPL